jgi:DNA-binding NarL/FixJ family response regulator
VTGHVRVVVADDHAIVRDGLRALFATTCDLEVVGEAATAEELLDAVARLSPDVAVVDVEMPGGGISAVRELDGAVKVVVLTMHDDSASLVAALRAGAAGFVVKGAGADEVIDAVRGVARGVAVLGSGVADQALQLVASGGRGASVFPGLTLREHEVLDLLAAGLDNEEIALRLGLTLKTVRNNVASVYTKLQVPDRAKAVVVARKAGLGRTS